jgi:hypothetical protein
MQQQQHCVYVEITFFVLLYIHLRVYSCNGKLSVTQALLRPRFR